MKAKRFFYVCAGMFLLALTYHLGARTAQAQVGGVPELATLSGTLNDGQTIPLPTYSDGTRADEAECKWTVSLRDVNTDFGYTSFFHCSADNRVVSAYDCTSNCVPTDPTYFHCSVNFLIIATRVTAPVSVERHTLGQLKARFRDPAPTGR